MPHERVSRKSGHQGARSPSSNQQPTRAMSPNRRVTPRSPSPDRRRARSPSPARKAVRSSKAQISREERSFSPTRNGLRSPGQIRKANRSKSPDDKGYHSLPSRSHKGPYTLERFAMMNFSIKPAKRPTVIAKSGSGGGMIWQHTTEPIQKPLLQHLSGNQQLSGRACSAFKAIMKYMGDYPTKKANLQGTLMTDKIFSDAMRYEELRDEIYCQIIKQLTNNILNVSEERGWELMWLATGLFPSSDTLRPELTKFLRWAQHKLAEDCQRRLQMVSGLPQQRKYPPHWVEVETIQHHYTQIFHFIFLPDDKSNASFQVSSTMTVADLCKSIANRLGLTSNKGFGLFLIMSSKVVALHEESDFFFDALRRQIDWEQEENDMPVLAYQMFFLRKIWTDVVPGEDSQADTIFHYHQELSKFLRGYHHCPHQEDAAKLAALQFRARYGSDKAELQNVAKRLADFLPKDLLRSRSVDDWKRAIISTYNQPWITSMTKDAAKVAFLKIMYRWPTFGSSFFEVAKVTGSENTENVLLAINKQGVLIIDQQTKEVQKTFLYSEIQGWSGSEQSDFFLTVGNESKGVMKLHFKTKLGYKMDDLLTSYVRYKQKRPASGQNSTKAKLL
ncbi:myosin-VIIa-like isoform X2 [Acanthaster planci]|uniref:Myosin-VIIa-like isoform X2 n=1 Tax=Acanthaster planci TaxID=133434 RepID=A0A8B7XMX0_ACAPL|nr:myosin-VIIa-like isoform X2 [Acanthaster planci]